MMSKKRKSNMPAELYKLQSFSVAEIEEAKTKLPVSGAKMEKIKVEFLVDVNPAKSNQNQQMMDMIVKHCQKNLAIFHIIQLTPTIKISNPMPSVEYLLIKNSEFGEKNTNLSDLFPNVQYLELHNIKGTPANLRNLLKQSFQHLKSVWLDCSKDFNNRMVRTFLERNTKLTKLTLEFGSKGMTKHFFMGIDQETPHLQNLTIVPAIPCIHAHQTFTFEPLLFQELHDLNIHGYYNSEFDLFSYLSISNENVTRMTIEAFDLNAITIRGIGFYVFLQELTISAYYGLNFANLNALVKNLTGLRKIEIIKIGSSDDLRKADEFLAFIGRFGQMKEFILKNLQPPHGYCDALRNGLDDAVWTVQQKDRDIRVHKT